MIKFIIHHGGLGDLEAKNPGTSSGSHAASIAVTSLAYAFVVCINSLNIMQGGFLPRRVLPGCSQTCFPLAITWNEENRVFWMINFMMSNLRHDHITHAGALTNVPQPDLPHTYKPLIP